MKKNCLIAQSGGPTSVINASVYGLVREAQKADSIDRVMGAKNGIKGVLDDHIFDFANEEDCEIEKLRTSPASALGSCRYKLNHYEETDCDYNKIFEVFEALDIGYFFYVGGNDSMDTVDQLSKYAKEINSNIRILGIPKTIDNDLPETDHCPGFGSAAKYIATSTIEAFYDGEIYDKNIVTIIETMGRNAGWLAASAALASEDYDNCPDLIYLPEAVFDFDKFKSDVKAKLEKRGKVVIVASEGIKNSDGDYISAVGNGIGGHDQFGHVQLGGVGEILKEFVQTNIEKRVKVIKFDVLQRAAAHCTSKTDIEEAENAGRAGVKFALEGYSGKMVAYKCSREPEYKCEMNLVDVSKVANKEKMIPTHWINEEGNFVTDECIEYMRPLICGENDIPHKNGLPQYAKLKMDKLDM
ncbi:MAG: 6-phosphofructokinase [Tissierellales bacterium]|jgi:6-phosphofructokinase 1|nr:6-phosphofructokinase [Tissierellales bacterium]